MRNDEHVAVRAGAADSADDPVGSLAHLLERLPVRPRPPPDRPVREVAADLVRGPTLQRAIVPLHQIVVGYGDVTEAGDPGGLCGTRQRAGQDQAEAMTSQAAAEVARLLAPVLGQGDVRPTRVAPESCPFGLAVADEPRMPIRRRLQRHAQVRSLVSGGALSAGSAAKNSRACQPKSGAMATPGTWAMRVL